MILKRLVRLTGQSLTQKQGAAAEELALAHLQRAGLVLVCRNYRAAGGSSGKQLGEIDLIMPLTAGATFDGHPAGWCVYEAGSAHSPTVNAGQALVLYLLPQGAIQFT